MKQYFHQSQSKDKFTVVLDVPPKFTLLDLHSVNPIVFDVGVTQCSPEDNYVKQIGRTEACKNIRIGRFKLLSIIDQGSYWQVGLTPFDCFEKEIQYLEFKVFKIGDSVHFVFAETTRL